RQFALERCTQDWVLWIDADERLGGGAGDSPWRTIESAGGAARAACVRPALRTSYFLGRRIRHCGWAGEWIPRFFTRAGARFDAAPVHERRVRPRARRVPRRHAVA